MRRLLKFGLLLPLVATLAFAAGSAFVAYAAQSASQIYGCVNSSSGTIKIVEAATICKQNETQLVWNTQGPPGPQGDTGAIGATGPQGPQGQRGPSDGWTSVRGFANPLPLTLNADVTVSSKTLPAGNFLLNGYADLRNTSSTDAASGYCYLSGNNRLAVYYDLPPGVRMQLPLAASESVGAGWAFEVRCQGLSGSAEARSAFATAVQVDALH